MKTSPEKINDLITFVKGGIGIHSNMTMTRLQLFLEVGMNEGITTSDLKDKYGMLPRTLRKNIRVLGKFIDYSKGSAALRGFGLVKTERARNERTKHACFLTKKGEKVYAEVLNLMKNESIAGWCFEKVRRLVTG
jgi:DNA-binding MarR family transcriptional regulator